MRIAIIIAAILIIAIIINYEKDPVEKERLQEHRYTKKKK